MKKLLLIVLSVLFLCACDNSKSVKPQKFSSYNTTFEITADNTWTEVSDKGTLNEQADIEIFDEKNQKYLIAITDSKKDLPWKYNEYVDYILKKEADVYGFDVKDTKQTKIGEYDSTYVSFTTDIDGKKFYMNIFVVETKNYYGQIIMWTKASAKENIKDEFIKIVQSFKQVEEE